MWYWIGVPVWCCWHEVVTSSAADVLQVQQENKILRRQKTLQDKALDKYEYQENDMTSILQRHAEEVNYFKMSS